MAILGALGCRFRGDERKSEEHAYFRDLTALALGFLLLPLLAWGAGVVVLKAFTTRYVLHWLFGVFLLLPLIAARAFRLDRVLGLALLAACGLPASVYVGLGTVRAFRVQQRTDDLALLESAVCKLSGDIAVSDPHLFTQLVDYSPVLKARCVYLWDRANDLRYTGQDVSSLNFMHAARMGWFRSEPWGSYRNRDKAFLLLTVPDCQPDGGWLQSYLKAAGRYGEVVAKVGQHIIVAAKPIEVGATP